MAEVRTGLARTRMGKQTVQPTEQVNESSTWLFYQQTILACNWCVFILMRVHFLLSEQIKCQNKMELAWAIWALALKWISWTLSNTSHVKSLLITKPSFSWSKSGWKVHTCRSLHFSDALKMQIEVQKPLHKQLEVRCFLELFWLTERNSSRQ